MVRLRAVFILLFAYCAAAPAQEWLRCIASLGFFKLTPSRAGMQRTAVSPWRVTGDSIQFDGVEVTGHQRFSERVVLNNLDCFPEQNASWSDARNFQVFKDRRILSLGEGMNVTVLMLLKNGYNARAVDTFYHRTDYPEGPGTEPLHWFLDQYRASPDALIQGDARKLNLPDESEDLVFSHQLLPNLTIADQKRVLMEAIRITSVGGENRHYELGADIADNVINFLKSTYGNSIEITTRQKQSETLTEAGLVSMSGTVLIIRKNARTGHPSINFAPNEEMPTAKPNVILRQPPRRIEVRGLR